MYSNNILCSISNISFMCTYNQVTVGFCVVRYSRNICF